MRQVELEFPEAVRQWSSDHGSICFSGMCEGKEVRFFLPRACFKALNPHSATMTEDDFIQLFDTHRENVLAAAKLVFARDEGISSAYVITDLAIDAVRNSPAAISPQLAA